MSQHEPHGGEFETPVVVRQGLTAVSLLIVLIVAYMLIKVQLVLILVLLSILFATIIERPVLELERRRFPRALSILTVYVAVIGAITLSAILVAPTFSKEAHSFRAEAPAQIRELQDRWDDRGGLLSAGADILGKVSNAIENPVAPSEEMAIGIATGVGGGVVGIFTVLIITFYYLMEKELLRRLVLMQINPTSRARINGVWEDVEAQVGRWLRGQLSLCLVIGTLSLIGYGTMGLRFWPVLGLWAGLTEIIPIVGPWLGGVPAVIIAMTMSWDKALLAGGFVIVLQVTENAVLVPRVMKGAVGLTPLTVFVAILFGTEFMGIAGALLAIPVAAAVQVIIADYLKARRMATTSPAEQLRWRWMRGARQENEENEPMEPGNGTTAPPHHPSGWSSQVMAQVAAKQPEPHDGGS